MAGHAVNTVKELTFPHLGPMSDMLLHLKPEQVEIGMFVDAFDGRWIDHPFWRSRFLVETAEQLALIRESGVIAVIVDRNRSQMVPGTGDETFGDYRRKAVGGMSRPTAASNGAGPEYLRHHLASARCVLPPMRRSGGARRA